MLPFNAENQMVSRCYILQLKQYSLFVIAQNCPLVKRPSNINEKTIINKGNGGLFIKKIIIIINK